MWHIAKMPAADFKLSMQGSWSFFKLQYQIHKDRQIALHQKQKKRNFESIFPVGVGVGVDKQTSRQKKKLHVFDS